MREARDWADAAPVLCPGAMLHLNDISLRVGGELLLEHASVHLPAGHRAGLVGRNGSGKTSHLR
jgi:ATP-binding cassette subfamily F protein 3